MTNQFEYGGYIGSAEVDAENHVLFGRLLFIRDAIGYSAETVEGLESAFREAVDDYLAACAEEGSEPDVPCKGSFNVRVGPERHRKVALAARSQGLGLNEFVCVALDDAIEPHTPQTVIHNHPVTVMYASQERTAFTSEPQNLTVFANYPAAWGESNDAAKH